jgi:hypothetical protein
MNSRVCLQYEQSHHMNWRQPLNMVLHCWFADDFECSATEYFGIKQARYIEIKISIVHCTELEFLNSLLGLGTEEE